MDREKEVLEWATRQVDLVVSKFSSSKNLPVYFNDFDSMLPNISYPIPGAREGVKGGALVLIHNGEELKTIDYKFFVDTVLDIHHHPDFIECFKILKGSMTDELTGIERHEGDYFEILPYTPHQWRCTKDAHMMIHCKKVL